MKIISKLALVSGAALASLSPLTAFAQGPEAPRPDDASDSEPSDATGPTAQPAPSERPAEIAPPDERAADEAAASERAASDAAPVWPSAAPEPDTSTPLATQAEPTAAPLPAPLPAALPPPVPEAQPLRLHPSGSFFSRLESRDGFYRLGVDRGRTLEGDLVAYRARFGVATDPVDLGHGGTVSVQLTPQASGLWGELPSTLTDAGLGLHEGYVRLEYGGFGLDSGRFEMVYGDHLVIGNVGWHQTGRSFDGIRSRIALGGSGASLDVFFTQVAEGILDFPADPGAGDAYFTGVYAMVGPALADQLALDVYVLTQLWPYTQNVLVEPDDPASLVATQQSAGQVTLGSRVKHRLGPVDLRVEAGVQSGYRPRPDTRLSALAYQADAEMGINAVEDRFRFALEGLYASGDDPDTADRHEGWDPLYPTAHKWLGQMDIVGGRTNVYGGVAHLTVQLLERLALKWQGHLYFRPRHPSGVGGYAGAELDSGVIYTLGQGLKVRGMWGHFVGHSDHYAAGAAADYGELELRYDFK